MQTFTVTPPNTCGLVVTGAQIAFIDVVGAVTFAQDAATFSEYLTADDALAAALVIDPSYDPNLILGPLVLEIVDVSESEVSATYGDSVTFDSEFSCTDLTATVSYQWVGPDNTPISGATSSSYTITNALTLSEGSYTCEVSASNPDNQTAATSTSFSLTVTEPVATFNLTRSGNNIASGFITALRGFSVSDCSLYLVESATTITYDPLTNGFETTGGELGPGEKTFEIFINGAFVRSFSLPSGDGTYSFHL